MRAFSLVLYTFSTKLKHFKTMQIPRAFVPRRLVWPFYLCILHQVCKSVSDISMKPNKSLTAVSWSTNSTINNHSGRNFIVQPFSGLGKAVSKNIYEKSNRLAEKLSKIITTILIKIMYQNSMFPVLIFNFYAYFVMESNEGTFQWSFIFPYW